MPRGRVAGPTPCLCALCPLSHRPFAVPRQRWARECLAWLRSARLLFFFQPNTLPRPPTWHERRQNESKVPAVVPCHRQLPTVGRRRASLRVRALPATPERARSASPGLAVHAQGAQSSVSSATSMLSGGMGMALKIGDAAGPTLQARGPPALHCTARRTAHPAPTRRARACVLRHGRRAAPAAPASAGCGLAARSAARQAGGSQLGSNQLLEGRAVRVRGRGPIRTHSSPRLAHSSGSRGTAWRCSRCRAHVKTERARAGRDRRGVA